MRRAKSFKLEQGIRTEWPTQQKRKSGGVLERPRNWRCGVLGVGEYKRTELSVDA